MVHHGKFYGNSKLPEKGNKRRIYKHEQLEAHQLILKWAQTTTPQPMEESKKAT